MNGVENIDLHIKYISRKKLGNIHFYNYILIKEVRVLKIFKGILVSSIALTAFNGVGGILLSENQKLPTQLLTIIQISN